MTQADLIALLAPTTPYVHDPYGGRTKEDYESRDIEKKLRRARQRANKALASDPQTPNRQTWACQSCFKSIERGEPFWFLYAPHNMTGAIKCAECHESLPTGYPLIQATLVREVL